MKTISISGQTGESKIIIGERIGNLSTYLPETRVVVITDTQVAGHYGRQFPDAEVITIGCGEAIKTLDTAMMIYERLVSIAADRTVFLVGIGGGIVCDITGFIASTYMRGVRFGYVATTLLAQVDASVGGKNGVNFMGYKNMVGVFNQPAFVLCDPYVLNTLSEREIACGFAEIVKHAAIADKRYFVDLETSYEKALALDPETLERIIHASVVIKAGVVNADEREQGERRKLNFGHTLGHAIEKTLGVPHGEAISAGMVMAAKLSANRGLLTDADVRRLKDLLAHLHLPTALPIDSDRVIDAMARDKKRQGERIHFVLLSAIGAATVDSISLSELEAAVAGQPAQMI